MQMKVINEKAILILGCSLPLVCLPMPPAAAVSFGQNSWRLKACFPVEWLTRPRRCDACRASTRPRGSVFCSGRLEKNPAVKLHIVVLRKQFARNLTFARNGVTFHLIKTPGWLARADVVLAGYVADPAQAGGNKTGGGACLGRGAGCGVGGRAAEISVCGNRAGFIDVARTGGAVESLP